jgi:hypothetical protein
MEHKEDPKLQLNFIKRSGDKNEDELQLYLTGAYYDCTLNVSKGSTKKVINIDCTGNIIELLIYLHLLYSDTLTLRSKRYYLSQRVVITY